MHTRISTPHEILDLYEIIFLILRKGRRQGTTSEFEFDRTSECEEGRRQEQDSSGHGALPGIIFMTLLVDLGLHVEAIVG